MLLLDELEKAHPDIYTVLLQVMDNASLTDNMGRRRISECNLDYDVERGARELASSAIGFRRRRRQQTQEHQGD